MTACGGRMLAAIVCAAAASTAANSVAAAIAAGHTARAAPGKLGVSRGGHRSRVTAALITTALVTVTAAATWLAARTTPFDGRQGTYPVVGRPTDQKAKTHHRNRHQLHHVVSPQKASASGRSTHSYGACKSKSESKAAQSPLTLPFPVCLTGETAKCVKPGH